MLRDKGEKAAENKDFELVDSLKFNNYFLFLIQFKKALVCSQIIIHNYKNIACGVVEQIDNY